MIKKFNSLRVYRTFLVYKNQSSTFKSEISRHKRSFPLTISIFMVFNLIFVIYQIFTILFLFYWDL